ncbi:MAG: HAD family hydrolase [Blastocatellia bacterium]
MQKNSAARGPRAVLFDFNGVIINDEPLHWRLMQEVLAAHDIPVAPADYDKFLGRADRACFAIALTASGRDADAQNPRVIDALIAQKSALYMNAIARQDLLFPGVAELIRSLSGIHALAVVSGALRREIETALEHGGIRDCFDVMISSEDVTHSKPDPEGFLRALEQMNRTASPEIRPDECLVIEDSLHGVEAARRAGMRCLAVSHSYDADRLAGAGAVVDTLAGCDLAAMFARMR